MGTRSLTAVFSNGEYKVAQYGQWDGYPDGVGADILNFISASGNIDKLKSALERVRFLEPEGRDKEFHDAYENNAPEWSSDPDNRTDEQKEWFGTFISRDIGGEILKNIADSDKDEIIIRDSLAFAGDSLFCEYAYVVDLDKGTFEVFEGFNKEPIEDGRFVSGDDKLEQDKNGEYHPVKLVKSYPLDSLPDQATLNSDVDPEEDDDCE